MKSRHSPDSLPFGQLLGIAPGNVPALSSDYDQIDSKLMPDRFAFRHFVNGVYTGYKWQCVEFARRWMLLNHGYVFDDVAMAHEIFRLTSVRSVENGQRFPLRAFANGSVRHPRVGDLLVWQAAGEFEDTGHVAVITEVLPHCVRVAEQNVHFTPWNEGSEYARELPIVLLDDGGMQVACTFLDTSILGWVSQTSENLHALPPEQKDRQLFLPVSRQLPQGTASAADQWLNTANPDEAAFVTAMGGHRLASKDSDLGRYYRLSETAHDELKRASNELHALFMYATDYVLRNEKLLARFNIPEELWPRIRQSFANRNNHMVTGRFDFCVSEKGIRLFEYNADSASCYLEAGKIQGLWAKHYHCAEGRDPGRQLWPALVDAWKRSQVRGTLHIMQDNDQEETYHAQYMRSAMEAAGLECVLIKGIAELQWGEQGEALDSLGREIRWVWKTWAWETALEQLRQSGTDASMGRSPELQDVLLRRGVMVYEPLWTVITSNKALLPILSELYPENPYLLDSRYELTDRLQGTGYVTKPIAGRSGDNVSLYDKQQDLVGQTDGQFEHQQQIYQELWRLPEIDGERVQLCSFSVQGHYAGSCARVDRSPIITSGSDILPLRIVPDQLLHS